MRALVASPGSASALELREVDEPVPSARQAVVTVRAISLNRGEVRGLARAQDGARPGWDVAGEVLAAAADGHGPRAGTRVVGLVDGGAWGERVAVATNMLAAIPDELSFAAAATLPVAGLTATRALGVAGLHHGSRVLVTGASGGVGRFAIQLAGHLGADVTAVVGRTGAGEGLTELGASSVLVGLPPSGEREFDIILESIGGESLGTALSLIAPCGTIVSFGNSSDQPTTFDARTFFPRSGARLYAFMLLPELDRAGGAAHDLAHLAIEMGAGRLDPQIDRQASWREAADVVQAMLGREIHGKAVLTID